MGGEIIAKAQSRADAPSQMTQLIHAAAQAP
jgi:hypothetical protein